MFIKIKQFQAFRCIWHKCYTKWFLICSSLSKPSLILTAMYGGFVKNRGIHLNQCHFILPCQKYKKHKWSNQEEYRQVIPHKRQLWNIACTKQKNTKNWVHILLHLLYYIERQIYVTCCFNMVISKYGNTLSTAGGRLNKKDGLTRYGNSHVKDKTS